MSNCSTMGTVNRHSMSTIPHILLLTSHWLSLLLSFCEHWHSLQTIFEWVVKTSNHQDVSLPWAFRGFAMDCLAWFSLLVSFVCTKICWLVCVSLLEKTVEPWEQNSACNVVEISHILLTSPWDTALLASIADVFCEHWHSLQATFQWAV